MTHFIVIVW